MMQLSCIVSVTKVLFNFKFYDNQRVCFTHFGLSELVGRSWI